jgi:hypothetical protein
MHQELIGNGHKTPTRNGHNNGSTNGRPHGFPQAQKKTQKLLAFGLSSRINLCIHPKVFFPQKKIMLIGVTIGYKGKSRRGLQEADFKLGAPGAQGAGQWQTMFFFRKH